MHTIADTLLSSLFFKDPPFMPSVLAEHESTIFPRRQEFIHFLQESDSQKRIESAHRLIDALLLESGLLLPKSYFSLLLASEERTGPQLKSDTYVQQDHYVHLVELYLLGLYVFFYHKKIHRKLLRHFKSLRQRTANSIRSTEEGAFLDFLFCWRAFVLLHDITYPLEMGSAFFEGHAEKVRESYNRLPEILSRETANIFIAKMAAWHNADKHLPNIRLKDITTQKLLSRGGRVINPAAAQQLPLGFTVTPFTDYGEWSRTSVIHGTRYLGTLTSVVPTNEIAAILLGLKTGSVILSLTPRGNTHDLQIYKDDLPADVLSQLQYEASKYAFSYGKTFRIGSGEEQEWNFFVANYQERRDLFIEALYKYGNGELHRTGTAKAIDDLSDEIPATSLTITSDKDYRDSEHFYYSLASKYSWANEDLVPHLITTSEAKKISREVC